MERKTVTIFWHFSTKLYRKTSNLSMILCIPLFKKAQKRGQSKYIGCMMKQFCLRLIFFCQTQSQRQIQNGANSLNRTINYEFRYLTQPLVLYNFKNVKLDLSKNARVFHNHHYTKLQCHTNQGCLDHSLRRW